MVTIDEIVGKLEEIKANIPKIGPGNPFRFSEAATVNDRVWQGDLAITIADKVPDNYEPVNCKEKDRQLVPGNTEGSKHCLDSLDGVTMYRPKNWGMESLDGPYLILNKERTIMHPTHGHITIPAGFAVHCTYQVNLDEMERMARAKD